MWKAKLDEHDPKIPGGITAAAKVLSTESDEAREELCKEAMVSAQLSGSPHVVALLGVVTAGTPSIMLVSYCEHGNILDLLRQGVERRDAISVIAKLQYGVQICRGMEYLAQKQVVHRDLVRISACTPGTRAHIHRHTQRCTYTGQRPHRHTQRCRVANVAFGQYACTVRALG